MNKVYFKMDNGKCLTKCDYYDSSVNSQYCTVCCEDFISVNLEENYVMCKKENKAKSVKLLINSYEDRRELVGILADAGYSVKVVNEKTQYGSDYYVIIENLIKEIE